MAGFIQTVEYYQRMRGRIVGTTDFRRGAKYQSVILICCCDGSSGDRCERWCGLQRFVWSVGDGSFPTNGRIYLHGGGTIYYSTGWAKKGAVAIAMALILLLVDFPSLRHGSKRRVFAAR